MISDIYNYANVYIAFKRDHYDLELKLEDYEREVLVRLYNEGIIKQHYFAIEKVRLRIRWLEISQKHRVKKSFSLVIRKLYNKGYINFGGKSGDVCSLSEFGAAYVKGSENDGSI